MGEKSNFFLTHACLFGMFIMVNNFFVMVNKLMVDGIRGFHTLTKLADFVFPFICAI